MSWIERDSSLWPPRYQCSTREGHVFESHHVQAWICGGVVASWLSALVSRTSGPCSSPGLGHSVAFLGKTVNSHSACINLGAWIGSSESLEQSMVGGNPIGGGNNTLSRLMLKKPELYCTESYDQLLLRGFVFTTQASATKVWTLLSSPQTYCPEFLHVVYKYWGLELVFTSYRVVVGVIIRRVER